MLLAPRILQQYSAAQKLSGSEVVGCVISHSSSAMQFHESYTLCPKRLNVQKDVQRVLVDFCSIEGSLSSQILFESPQKTDVSTLLHCLVKMSGTKLTGQYKQPLVIRPR